jgi:hypothetical protein
MQRIGEPMVFEESIAIVVAEDAEVACREEALARDQVCVGDAGISLFHGSHR